MTLWDWENLRIKIMKPNNIPKSSVSKSQGGSGRLFFAKCRGWEGSGQSLFEGLGVTDGFSGDKSANLFRIGSWSLKISSNVFFFDLIFSTFSVSDCLFEIKGCSMFFLMLDIFDFIRFPSREFGSSRLL